MPVDFHLLSFFSVNIPFLFENRGALDPGYVNRSNTSLHIAFGAVQVFLILILSVLSRHVNRL